jgi:diaminopimelate epimerase
MRIFNPDGSEAEACGNGLRCFAKYVIERGIVSKTTLAVETLSGIRQVKASMSRGRVSRVEVSMGTPQFQPEQIPISIEVDIIPILNYPLLIGERKLALALLSMGNPHAVSFLSESVDNFPLTEIGPEVEKNSLFPRRTNFEIARVLNGEKIEARIWERGVGETLACGSGACAVAVTAQLLGYVDKQVDITLPGGTLTVFWDRVGEVLLTGPVEEVFVGEWLERQYYEEAL